ncbi:HTH_48 domain-containing protein [Trichonephila clavipes]|uniref:HTH_48 domain-containing protein n=1 Tax=Trichonephila clavipes TaxID=2585209 RepID=A0A8X6VR99_TRICX|nr:HTH_48 domain-containing protein [Trichonephila clavipes]
MIRCVRSRFNLLAISEKVDHKEQSVWRSFCFLLGNTTDKTFGILRKAFTDEALGKSQVYKCFSCIKSDNMPHPERLSTEGNDGNVANSQMCNLSR